LNSNFINLRASNETCIEPSFVADDIFNMILSELKTFKTPEEIVDHLPKILKELSGKMISPENTKRLIIEINFGDQLEYAVRLLEKYLWLTSKSLAELLVKIKSLKQRNLITKNLFPSLLDHDKINFELIRDSMDCGDKSLIDSLSLDFKPKNCFFGDLSGDIVFVIDLSGSMMFPFNFKGERLTRLAFLKQLFKVAINSLDSTQRFQIVTFASNAKYIFGNERSIYAASDNNKKAIIERVDKLIVGNGTEGYTNISEALEFAYKVNFEIANIIVFSDGGPTRGVRSLEGMTKVIADATEERKKKGFTIPPVNMNMLMLGGTEGEAFRDNAKAYSNLISKTTLGIVKNYDMKVGFPHEKETTVKAASANPDAKSSLQ
jgi:hypothetical protein